MAELFDNLAQLGASGYVFRIVDNGGATADRYTVQFCDGDALCLSDSPSHPLGVSQWAEGIDPATLAAWVETGEAVDLRLGDLPGNVQGHILARVNQAFGDFLDALEAGDPEAVAPSREAADVNEGIHDSAGVGIYRTGEFYFVRLDGAPDDDRGPFQGAAAALRASLPDEYGLAGPEYHSTVTAGSLTPQRRNARLRAAVDALDALEDAGADAGKIEAAKARVGEAREMVRKFRNHFVVKAAADLGVIFEG